MELSGKGFNENHVYVKLCTVVYFRLDISKYFYDVLQLVGDYIFSNTNITYSCFANHVGFMNTLSLSSHLL